MTLTVFNATARAAQNTQALKKVWENLTEDSCPLIYNFHLHTIYSDGQLQPEDLIRQAVSIGLKGLAITDHHSVGGFLAAQSWLEATNIEQTPHLWTGVEITSDLQNDEVHILGYGFEPEHPALKPYLGGTRPKGSLGFAGNVIAALHQAGGLAVLAHPARYQKPAHELIPAAAALGIDGAEAYYAYGGNPKPWKPTPHHKQQVKQLCAEYGLFTTCGTDTHGLNLLYRI
ncbi:MAG: PHP domain-containing protein [Gomphosphaeria aponina SAG 52.96 = DSM 107014]|uniref:PHP domain-containing protein n=1 Tax=Gomphosphaeria aponina SAG 52.96 = DSM 107014 TaxID=1521640 RepID=A0A941GWB9_9CHRO|nr:PHP domain-containing protein [Gomphosphaeria aponina SAG 52.96 = DSM 107014]